MAASAAAWLGVADKTIDVINKGLTLAERIEDFVRKYKSDDKTAFVKDLANKIFYDNKEEYNVMIFNLSLPTPPAKGYKPDPKPSGVVSYSSHKFKNTTYGVWVFNGSGQWTNLGEFGYHNWMGIGYIKRFDADGTENDRGRIMKFDSR